MSTGLETVKPLYTQRVTVFPTLHPSFTLISITIATSTAVACTHSSVDEIDYFSMEYAVVVLVSLLASGAATGENKVIRVGKEHKSLPVYR